MKISRSECLSVTHVLMKQTTEMLNPVGKKIHRSAGFVDPTECDSEVCVSFSCVHYSKPGVDYSRQVLTSNKQSESLGVITLGFLHCCPERMVWLVMGC